MKEYNLVDFSQKINEKKSVVEQEILKSKGTKRVIRTRERDPEEIEILDKISITRWKESIQKGKIKYLNKKEWYYDPS